MTIQFLKYIVSVAEIGSITEAAKHLHISQPSLSAAIRKAEKEVGFSVFTRSRAGISLTKEGVEFLGYARQVIQEMNLLEDRFIANQPEKPRFCVSTQHYTFTANAFVEMVKNTGRTGFITPYNKTLPVLPGFELLIATIGTIATLTWIGMGLLIQKIYLKHYRIINIILALTLAECIWSMLR